MCFTVDTVTAPRNRKVYKYVNGETRKSPIRGRTYYRVGKTVRNYSPGLEVRQIGAMSRAGIYVYLTKRSAQKACNKGNIVIALQVKPEHFISGGTKHRGRKVATYRYAKVIT